MTAVLLATAAAAVLGACAELGLTAITGRDGGCEIAPETLRVGGDTSDVVIPQPRCVGARP